MTDLFKYSLVLLSSSSVLSVSLSESGFLTLLSAVNGMRHINYCPHYHACYIYCKSWFPLWSYFLFLFVLLVKSSHVIYSKQPPFQFLPLCDHAENKRNAIKARCKFNGIVSHFFVKGKSASNFVDFGSSNFDVTFIFKYHNNRKTKTKKSRTSMLKISSSTACVT